MGKKPVITSVQLLLLAVGSALVFPYTFMPILNAPPANQDVWIVLLASFIIIIILNLPLLILINKFRGLNINQMSEITMGKVFGKIILIPVGLFCFFCFLACMLITEVFITLYIFPDTPPWVLYLFMIIPITYAAIKGAGVIGRLATFIVPLAILTALMFFVLSIEDMDFTILQPVFVDSTFKEIYTGAFLTAARYSEILIFWVFSCFLNKKDKLNKTYARTQVVLMISFLLILLPTITVLGVEYAKRTWNPYFTFTRQIEMFKYLERLQPFNIIAWFPCSLLKLSIYNYMASQITSGIFKVKSHKYFVIGFSVLAFLLSLLPILNKSHTIDFLRSDQIFPYIILPATLVVPLILFLTYIIRKKKINLTLRDERKIHH